METSVITQGVQRAPDPELDGGQVEIEHVELDAQPWACLGELAHRLNVWPCRAAGYPGDAHQISIRM